MWIIQYTILQHKLFYRQFTRTATPIAVCLVWIRKVEFLAVGPRLMKQFWIGENS